MPTRFFFVLLGPTGHASQYRGIGRAIATLMSDEVCIISSSLIFYQSMLVSVEGILLNISGLIWNYALYNRDNRSICLIGTVFCLSAA